MEPFTKLAENETAQLQRAVFAQYIMMKKLFMELEEEREASSSAASAALSMIRKLQKEKEAERMEACQYRRMAEERMNHSDKALEVVKEVMQHKELEIYYLRSQLQVYKQRLLGVGIDDCDIADETITKSIPLFGSRDVENLCYTIKRNFSLPTFQLSKRFAEMDMNKNNGSVASARSRLGVYMHNSSENELEQVSSDLKAIGSKESLAADMDSTEKHGEEPKPPSNSGTEHSCPSEGSSRSSPFLMAGHHTDICSQRATLVGKDVQDTLHPDPLGSLRPDHEMDNTADTLKHPELSKAPAEYSCTPTKHSISTKESETPHAVALRDKGSHVLSKFSATRKVGSMNNVDRHVRVAAASSTPRAGVERTRSRLKRVQSEKMIELNDPKKNKEQIIMLKEVYEQLNMIEAHMRPSPSQETPRNDQSLDSVMEKFMFTRTQKAKMHVIVSQEPVGVLGLKREVERIVLEKPVDPRQVRFLEKFEREFHEEATVLESQNFDTKAANRLGCAHNFSGDKAFCPGAIFISRLEEGSTNSF
ncbi:hypothetical protein ACQJBY_068564 [Aegilops geniculata]